MRLALTPLSIDFDSKTGPIDPSEWMKSQISCRYWSWEKVMVNGVVVTNPEENLWDKTNKAWCFKCSVRSYGNASWVNKSIDVPKSNLNHKHHVYYLMHLSFNVMPAGRGRGGGGRACGGDLIVFVTPGDRAFDWSCCPRGGGDIWIFLRPTWRYLTADSDEKDWDRNICFPLPRFTHAPDGLERPGNHGGQREQAKAEWISQFCLQISFVLASFGSIEPLNILWYQSKRK